MIRFQKILLNFYLLLQFCIQLYLYHQQQLAHYHMEEDETPPGILSRLWFHLLMAIMVSIAFISINLRNSGRIVVNRKDLFMNDDLSDDIQERIQDKIQIMKENAENIQTQRAIIRKNQVVNSNTVPILPSKKGNDKNKSLNSFCHICQIYQPYRTKHCHQCDSCVATYDHHCPWMNTCVGQKNRPLYYIFLVLQLIQAFFLSVKTASIAINGLYDDRYAAGILSLSLILFVALIGALLGFHSYLMVKNLTTWQFIRSQHISYMKLGKKLTKTTQTIIHPGEKKQRKKYYMGVSPFSLGVLRNIREYWVCGFKKQRKIWQFQCQH